MTLKCTKFLFCTTCTTRKYKQSFVVLGSFGCRGGGKGLKDPVCYFLVLRALQVLVTFDAIHVLLVILTIHSSRFRHSLTRYLLVQVFDTTVHAYSRSCCVFFFPCQSCTCVGGLLLPLQYCCYCFVVLLLCCVVDGCEIGHLIPALNN